MTESHLTELLAKLPHMEEQERNAVLARLCRDSPELVPELTRRLEAGQDLEELTAHFSTGGGGSPGRGTDEPPNPEADISSPTGDFFLAGTVNSTTTPPNEEDLLQGRYHIQTLLGRGGFGEVFKAFDRMLEREVAIKTHRSDRRGDLGWRSRILKEARKLAGIDHPSVVRVHDVIEADGGVMIVSALVDGHDLSYHLHHDRMSLEEGVSVIIRIADALHHIHLKGLVHRDVKPGNILINKQKQPFLSDFGIAVSEEELLREHSGVVGTFAYMSPEQIQGDSHLVDARSDVYCLGVVLYEILTERVPFRGSTLEEYREQIRTRPPRPPRTIDDTLPPELERICLKCLAKAREDRYTTAADLAADLRAWQAPEAVPSLLPSPKSPPWPRMPIATGVVLFLGLILLVLTRYLPAPPPSEAGGEIPRVRAVPKPGEWFDLLEEEPLVRFRPERFAFQFDAKKRELWWDTRGDCLVRLGSTTSDDFELQVTFEQTQLAGHRGLFLGRPVMKAEKPNFTKCEAIVLTIDSLKQKQVAISRATLTVNEAAGEFDQLVRHGSRVLMPKATPSRLVLSVQVQQGRLAGVSLDHVRVEGLLVDNPPPAPGEPALVGEFGVFSGIGACRLPKAQFKISNRED